jgi:gamma-glutamylcyclotransferase (GGCT)/AIG2-like uncharacterized protein YtfP
MANPGIYHLFVYGTLRSGFRSEAYQYISRHFQLVGDARVRGMLFDMGNYPAAVPTTDERFIVGELYEINNPAEFSWVIGQLDDYEGVATEDDEVQLYQRELADVDCGGKNFRAWIYWFKGDVREKPLIESGDVLEYHRKKQPS